MQRVPLITSSWYLTGFHPSCAKTLVVRGYPISSWTDNSSNNSPYHMHTCQSCTYPDFCIIWKVIINFHGIMFQWKIPIGSDKLENYKSYLAIHLRSRDLRKASNRLLLSLLIADFLLLLNCYLSIFQAFYGAPVSGVYGNKSIRIWWVLIL